MAAINSNYFKDMLGGSTAFYRQPNYEKITRETLSQRGLANTTYVANTEYLITRIAKQIFAMIIFPVGLYQLLHSLVGKVALLPASSPSLIGYPRGHAERARLDLAQDQNWKYKRMTVAVDGYHIDAMIVGKPSTLANGRWMLFSNGNAGFYEHALHSHYFKQIVSQMQGNAIVFNYPGVGSSSGLPNRHAMTKAYRAVLTFLEDQELGIGAKEIIGIGTSIGGGVQGEALSSHQFKEGIGYLFVKVKTFGDLSTTASSLTCRPLGFLVKLLNWNLSSIASSKKLKVPEIIVQTARVKSPTELTTSNALIHDGIISAESSLAKALLDDPACRKQQKLFIGVPEDHNAVPKNPSFLTNRIKRRLPTASMFERLMTIFN